MNIREKILIVEDEKSIAHFISTILNSNDYETLLARSGSEAKTMISSHCPDPVSYTHLDVYKRQSWRGWVSALSRSPSLVSSSRPSEL